MIASSIDDPARFAVLFDRHYLLIRRYAYRRIGTDVAQDAVSETFAIAFSSRRDYDSSREDARPWLYGIATNVLRNHQRTERRRLLAYARAGVDSIAPDAFERSDEQLDAGALGPALAHALANLKPADRDVLTLVAWADLSHEGVGLALGIPVGTVKSRLSRARRQFRELLIASGQVLGEEAFVEGDRDERA